jgi:hypothetical protein
VLPDKSERTGKLDADGHAKITGLAAGVCQVSVPKLDQDAWAVSPAPSSP